MKQLVAGIFLIPAFAFAQPSPPPPPRTAHPEPAGAPHLCLEAYPPEAVATHSEGIATVAFVITKDGSLREVRIEKSSGNDSLDAASIRCVETWKYRPVVRDGEAIELAWRAEVKWEITPDDAPAVPDLQFAEPPRNCLEYYRVPAQQLPRAKATVLRIVVYEGSVRQTFLLQTSGYAVLNDQAAECVKTWRYIPLMKDGRPIATDAVVQIPWNKSGAQP